MTTPVHPTTARPPTAAAEPADQVAALAAYPHLARCRDCREYLDILPLRWSNRALVWALLAHHDSGHRHDPMSTFSEYFSPDD